MLKWLAKKYALSLVNDALKKLQQKTDIENYRAKTQAIISCLNNLLEALKDNEISKDECDKLITQVQDLF